MSLDPAGWFPQFFPEPVLLVALDAGSTLPRTVGHTVPVVTSETSVPSPTVPGTFSPFAHFLALAVCSIEPGLVAFVLSRSVA